MANTNSAEYTQSTNTPQEAVASWGKPVLHKECTITMASQAAADTLTLCDMEKGEEPIGFGIVSPATLGTATLSFGIAGNATKYSAALTHTTANAEVVHYYTDRQGTAPTETETLIVTTGVAALPASGDLVIRVYYRNNG